jgi:hypothetical protein
MSDSEQIADRPRKGLSRRDVITRGLAGAGIASVAWVNPVIKTVALAQNGDGSPPPGGNGGNEISFAALLLTCGSDTFRVKWDQADGTLTKSCGEKFAVDACTDQLSRNVESVEDGCPDGVTASFDSSSGELTVDLGDCTVSDFVVHCGACCAGPNESGQPSAGGTGSITFVPCTSNKAGCA